MKATQRYKCLGRTLTVLVTAVVGVSFAHGQHEEFSPAVQRQIASIYAMKSGLTPAQEKVEFNLMRQILAARDNGLALTPGVGRIAGQVPGGGKSQGGLVPVEIYGNPTPGMLAAVRRSGGQVLAVAAEFGVTDAALPLMSIEVVAANKDIKSITSMPKMQTNSMGGSFKEIQLKKTLQRMGLAPQPVPAPVIGGFTSQAYISHGANVAVANGYNGAGVKVGVLSDSASASRVATLKASGDLGAGTVVLDAGSGADEGTAMMEIVQDMAPGATLYFATAFNGVASFANNIIALKNAGCKVIVDDVSYFNEAVFQDGPIAQAVNTVKAAGVSYFSSAANSGNLTKGTSGCWEGDFADGGTTTLESGQVHSFGPATYDKLTAPANFVTLKWSDPLGGSSNDYDLFILNSAGTSVIAFSVSAQTGTQDPYEACSGNFGVGNRVVVVRFNGNTRAIHIDTNRSRLTYNTSGVVYGHNGGASTFSAAATYWNSAKTGVKPFNGTNNPIEVFSSDGPRRIFYNPDGSQIGGGVTFASGGGTNLLKPDFTGADGVTTLTPGFKPFFGTSAAAPHLAGIAALVMQAKPTYTPNQVFTAMKAASLDNMAAGWDRDGGWGIPMAYPAVQYALGH